MNENLRLKDQDLKLKVLLKMKTSEVINIGSKILKNRNIISIKLMLK